MKKLFFAFGIVALTMCMQALESKADQWSGQHNFDFSTHDYYDLGNGRYLWKSVNGFFEIESGPSVKLKLGNFEKGISGRLEVDCNPSVKVKVGNFSIPAYLKRSQPKVATKITGQNRFLRPAPDLVPAKLFEDEVIDAPYSVPLPGSNFTVAFNSN